MELRTYARIVVEGPHANGHLRAIGPCSPEQAGAADGAKGLDRALALAVDPNQLVAFEQPELLTGDPRLRQPERARVLSAARAMAMARPDERGLDFEADAATETAAFDERGHDRLQKGGRVDVTPHAAPLWRRRECDGNAVASGQVQRAAGAVA